MSLELELRSGLQTSAMLFSSPSPQILPNQERRTSISVSGLSLRAETRMPSLSSSARSFFFVRGKGKEKKIKKLSLVREGASGQTGDRREGRKEVFAYLFWCKDCTDLRAKVFQSSISMICLSLTKPFATFLFAHNETLGSAPDRGS